MVKIETLNELSSLRNTGFGQPPLRHGLNLLYWFAKEAVDIGNGVLVPKINIKGKEFGFQFFNNRIDDDEDRLLPNQNLPYFEVGNLNAPRAEMLPDYVRPLNNQHYYGKGNMDRIIVRLNDRTIDRVYITQHSDPQNFSHSGTYRVSLGLINTIRNMEKNQFLQIVRLVKFQSLSGGASSQRENVDPQRGNTDDSWFSWCTIL
ncbi:uncharacterized protein LOC134326700 [Trichomycterus rosablanca]|uniref:uncharacterized protein LOC134326700 n=1 Tax=Trichomycterus rosablanca TaxID=2290929 RepID=UPI002F35A7BB